MLDISKFHKIIVANWKLNGSKEFIKDYFDKLEPIKLKSEICSVFCPPSIYLNELSNFRNNYHLGAQDCSIYNNGAYTGEINALMLRDLNCNFCIVGHSERRSYFFDTNDNVKKKSINLIKASINPIICVGETIDQKNKGLTKEILSQQINLSLPDNSNNKQIIIAYEPIWAIGTGLTPTLEEIDEIHYFLKKCIKKHQNFKIIYGGSVKQDNANNIMNLENVDGVLVGGTSLNPIDYVKILTSC